MAREGNAISPSHVNLEFGEFVIVVSVDVETTDKEHDTQHRCYSDTVIWSDLR